MKVWNLTPHTIWYNDGRIKRTLPSQGLCHCYNTKFPGAPIEDMCTTHVEYTGLDGLPDGLKPGDAIIVSVVAANYIDAKMPDLKEKVTVLVSNTISGSNAKRNERGRVTSIDSFIRR